MYYAQLSSDGICFGISFLSGKVDSENLIAIDEFDEKLLGMRYADGVWQEVSIPQE